MERLTYRDKDGMAMMKERGGWKSGGIDRLAAYEELMERWKLRSIEEADRIFQRVNALGGTDLMAQYRAIGSIDHLRDLLQTEQDGRLVVPCKVGATVYGHSRAKVSEYRVAVISLATYNWYLRCQNHNSDFGVTDADIGKTVFLTREEAEAALAQEGGTHEADSV